MKIAIIAGTFFPHAGGVQVEVHNVANKLEKNGNIVDVYVYKNISLKNNNYKIFKLNYFKLSILYILKFYLNINLKLLFNFFNFNFIDLNYNIYHFHFLTFKSLILIEYLKFHKKKIMVTFHGADIQMDSKINYGFRLNNKFNNYLKKIIKKVDGFQSISKNIYKDLIRIGVNKKKIISISNSIELEKFRKFFKKKKLNKIIMLITIGRYAKYKKGFDLLPKLGKKLIDKKIRFKWKIIGKNSNKLNENEFIKKNKKYFITIPNIQNNIEKYYPPKKLIYHYSSSNLYINLARVESFGLTFIEALACGLPIISCKTKGVDELLTNNKNGLFVNNLDDYVNKILKIQKEPKKYFELCKFAFISVKKYDLSKNALKIQKMYKNFIK